MPDTDSSEDETSARLLASVDTSFLNDALFNKPVLPTTEKETKQSKRNTNAVSNTSPAPDAPKSNRYVLEEETVMKSDLNVSEAMKKHMAAKLSNLIGSMIVFDDGPAVSAAQPVSATNNGKRKAEAPGVRLLSSFNDYLDESVSAETPIGPQKRPSIQRRKVKGEPKDPKSVDKIAASVIVPDTFPEEMRSWKGPKQRSTLFNYTKKGLGPCVEKERVNEFTEARLKNGWDESKIQTFKRKTIELQQ
ncbi:uncharacterized protein LOC131289551 [Anopheles ziemanni]|uniref:uncharacterized protein LOC131289551 n=1 Tax=Anopheles ziemanni TaxID=345580 RepID=UPI00265B5AE6|nr:uncharacterized protein LOC131260875 isoform X2 [Anopheles coustani]XP_058174817.1 uncharacterized protein LOC131289551 [Anopheles ziemanni]